MRITENSRWSAWSVDSVAPRRPLKRSIKDRVRSVLEGLRQYWRPNSNKPKKTIQTTIAQNRSPISDEDLNYLQQL